MGRENRKSTYTCSQHKFCSSRVVLNDDDLLTLILLRVPWRTLMSSKCVSRQWHSIITASHFVRLRSLPPLRASGLFLQMPHCCCSELNKVCIVHLDDPNAPYQFRARSFAHDPGDPDRICIVQSCKGLLLCCTAYSARVDIDECNHYVYNPSTNQVDTLPKHPCHNTSGIPSISLIFDPAKSLHYKVIAFLTRSKSNVDDPEVGDFYIYSSESGNWRVSMQSYFPSRDMSFRDGVYWNGCMHWLSEYTSSVPISDCLYFNVDEERLETFPSPPFIRSRGKYYFGESEDHLHCIGVCPYTSSFKVYEMKSDYSEWYVKYEIDLVPISKAFPEMNYCSFYTGKCFNVAVVSVIRRENLEKDSFLVLELPGKIVRYNLVDRSFKVIWDFSAVLKAHFSLRHWRCGNFKAWPYIE